ncbi:MAG TPA: YIP1 family protein [Candidatus Acidoferrales bacterium]|nr:YIP1 family protein [Candidatus Acidoferrales bacterium]
MAATTAAVPEAPQSMGAVARVFGALFSPRATFQDIARKPGWLLPVVILIIMNLGVTAVFSKHVGWRAFMEKQDLQSRRAQQQIAQMTPAQKERMIELQVKIAPIIGYVFGVIGVPIVFLILGAIFMGIFNATASAALDFKTSFSVAAHAWLPYSILGLLGILVMYLKPPDTVNIQNLVASNVGALLSNSAPVWLQTLCGSLDIFSFWAIGLLALGYSVARPKKLKMGTTLAWVIGVWFFFVLIRTGIAAVAG